jgi:hypothetical protein
VAVRTLPADGPRFLAQQEGWIAYLAIIPDLWRRPSEPFLKISEDPNHPWYHERTTFLHRIPRSRYEFVLAVYEEHKRLMATGDTSAATMMNVHWTGTLPYAAVENYERMVPAMRRYRGALAAGADTHFIELEIASYVARLGHYIGDGAQPLHVSIHSNGWLGSNPEGYATDRQIHGRFESRFVHGFRLEPDDVTGLVSTPKLLDDPFDAVLAHLDSSASYVEEVYRLDKAGALADFSNKEARALVLERVANAACLLRDLIYTAWVRSGEPVPAAEPESPISPLNPRYNSATGSAPAARWPPADR